jgi:hypothetical protein
VEEGEKKVAEGLSGGGCRGKFLLFILRIIKVYVD